MYEKKGLCPHLEHILQKRGKNYLESNNKPTRYKESMKSALKKWNSSTENSEEGYNCIDQIVRKVYFWHWCLRWDTKFGKWPTIMNSGSKLVWEPVQGCSTMNEVKNDRMEVQDSKAMVKNWVRCQHKKDWQ